MVQHILLTLVAPPLLALGAPITLLLRAVRPETRRRVILPILHSVPVRVMTFPVVTWLLFALAMWGTHFSPIFDRSLEDPAVHQLEHALYLVAGCLFWWPVVAPRSEPVAHARTGPDPLHVPPDAPELVPRARDPERDGPALRPLRDARPRLGPGGPRRPAPPAR